MNIVNVNNLISVNLKLNWGLCTQGTKSSTMNTVYLNIFYTVKNLMPLVFSIKTV
jgi:hypothetical protein